MRGTWAGRKIRMVAIMRLLWDLEVLLLFLQYKFQNKMGKRWPSLPVNKGLRGAGLGQADFYWTPVLVIVIGCILLLSSGKKLRLRAAKKCWCFTHGVLLTWVLITTCLICSQRRQEQVWKGFFPKTDSKACRIICCQGTLAMEL